MHRFSRGGRMAAATGTPRGRRRALIGRAVLALALMSPLACGDVTDTLLEATDPDLINPSDLDSPDGATALKFGALNRFRNMTAGITAAGTEGMWLLGGLLADEWSTSSTFQENDQIDKRDVAPSNASVLGSYRNVNRVRTAANQAIPALRKYFPDAKADIAEMYFARGFAELQLASDFCNGIPLSDASGTTIQFGTQKSVAEVFGVAIASFDTALATVSGLNDAASVRVRSAASIGKARALLGINRPADAATAVAGIATTYSYDHTFATTSGDNGIWSQGASQQRYVVGANPEGNTGTFPVGGAIAFFQLKDPRVPSAFGTGLAQDGQTRARNTTIWGRTTAVTVVNGVDARLVEAEAALKTNPTQMLSILNALRATPPKLGDVQPAGLAALTDPGTEAGRVDLLFRERAMWTFGRGERLGDLRRLVRQYGRPADQVFPTGQHYKGGQYGSAVNFQIPSDEDNNPSFAGCTDRNA
ncbi:MAG TPA: hypothetical protein VM076_25450 [Gemmatimonadaceae bacterium]|nr:hypothetical protein [Gemmatimonadaceae bacterium]